MTLEWYDHGMHRVERVQTAMIDGVLLIAVVLAVIRLTGELKSLLSAWVH
jgi:hypothetical protein